MAETTVRELAEVVGIDADRLMSQMGDAGLDIDDPDQTITKDEKLKLLEFLRQSHGKEGSGLKSPKKVTLKRRSRSALTVGGGRSSRTVNVEVKKSRTYVKRGAIEQDDPHAAEREEAARILEESRVEAEQREAAEKARREAEEQTRREAEDQAKRDAEEAERAKAEAERLKAEEEALAKIQESAVSAPEEPAEASAQDPEAKAAPQPEAAPAVATPAPEAPPKDPAREERQRKKREQKLEEEERRARKGKARKKGEPLHMDDRSGRKSSRRGRGRGRPDANAENKHGFSRPTLPQVREVMIPDSITVGELAQRMAVKAPEVIKQLMGMGAMVTINQPLDQETAQLVVEEMGHTPKIQREDEVEYQLVEQVKQDADDENASVRPPVVTVMGHVDHGKTSLLDYIRRAKVASGEAGGITQHIGAYHVETPKGVVTFLDTPGHAAFTAMRARGAQATDIVILVVAADDSVQPQTVEAIEHSRAAGVPVIVAINKMDKPDADPERVKGDLAKHELVPEDWGGDIMCVGVSAKEGTGVDEILDAVLLQSEVMELKAVVDAPATGVVVESSLEKGRGTVATILVQNGTLKKGDMLLAGVEYGRVRAMFNEAGQQVDEAGPSIPVQVLGLSGTPNSGDDVLVVADERKAKDVAQRRHAKQREGRLAQQQAAKLENLFQNMAEGDMKQVNLVVKADVQGSVEALRDALVKLSNEEVKVTAVASGVGGITESDATLAMASNAIVIGFNVRADAKAKQIIQENDLDLHYYSVIYDAIDEVKKAISGVLGTETREEIIGLAEVKDVFRSSKFGAIAGSIVVDGVVKRSAPIRVLRDNVVIFEGELESLRRYKDDVQEVRSGTECGIGVKDYNDVKPGDQIECFNRYEVQKTL
jgi:translation initiation factor IF-2